MVKLAFCDDDSSVLNELKILIEDYQKKFNKKIEYNTFDSPLELLAEIERGTRFDIVFLDILMPGESGIDAAAEIKEYDENVKIIFLTSSAEYALQSYSVGAFFYQLKPICRESFFRLIDSVLSACEKEHSKSLILRCKNGITRVYLKNIEFCEIIHRTLFIHLNDGKVLESIGSLDELYEQIKSSGGFIRTHRSFIVNLDYVQNISYKAVTMSSLTQIPIPRGKYQEIKDAFLEYAFENEQVLL